ncbi:MAG: DUF6600 domain-containing protein [Candidatus Aminicenantes bacterium]
MKKLTSLLAALIVSIPLGLAGQEETFYPYSFARLSYVNGDVYVQRASDLGYEKGEVNLALVQGDKMGTERGRAEVHFGRRNYLRLDENTGVEFAILPLEGQEYIKIHILEGRAFLRVSALVEDKGVEVHTPDASFYVLEVGLYRFDVDAARMTEAFVHEGSLEAASESGSVMVRSLESVSAADGRLLGDPDYFYNRGDEFDDWSRSRDSLLARRSDKRYLPQELDAYQEELDSNGSWVYERPYGYVWVPAVYESAWRPYHYGRWVWYASIGWNWVSSEPWGWAVYHYGRWHWRVGLGWYWIPHHHWRPAWVHWWSGSGYVGWCPLGWYNRPVVVINNYFYDRHFDNHFPAHNRALTVVHRNSLQDRNVHRHQIGQTELSRISKVSLKAQQPSVRPVVNTAGPQVVAAKRALSAGSAGQAVPKNIPSSRSLPTSRVSPRGDTSGAKVPARSADPSLPSIRRDSLSEGSGGRPAGVSTGSSERSIRSYPGRQTTGLQEQSGTSERRPPTMRKADPGAGSGAGDAPARVSPTIRQAPSSSKTDSGSAAQKIKKDEGRSSGTAVKKGEAIKNYPSTQGSGSSALSPRASSSGRAVRQAPSASSVYPSRLNPGTRAGSGQAPSASGRTPSGSRTTISQRSGGGRTEPSRTPAISTRAPASQGSSRMAAPSSRGSGSPSISRPSVSRPSSPSQPRSSYSSPSRSSAPSVRSAGGSGSRASSSSPSSSSSSSSRSSSGKSGGVKKKG